MGTQINHDDEKSVCDFIQQQLLITTSKLVELYRSGDESEAFRSAQYLFLWYTSLATTDALESAYKLMCKDGAHFDMPIDSKAAFGRIFIAAIALTDPSRANEVLENLIKPYTDPGEDAHLHEMISNAAKAYMASKN